MIKVSFVIPNWNGEEKLQRHLPHVLEAAKKINAEEVIVVDDASTDKSVDIITRQFPEVVIIRKYQNSGFSSTVNLGFSKSKGDLIALINNDASPQIDFLTYVLPHFQEKKVFSVGCNVGGLWTCGYFKNGYFWHQSAPIQEGKDVVYHKTLWSSGGSGIFRKSVWDELGGLDTLFDPFYEEDVDLGYRATKRGYLNIWESRSLVEHYKEAGVITTNFTQSFIQKIAQRNQLFFMWKNITSQPLVREHEKALVNMLITHPKYWFVFLAAIKHISEIRKKRDIEKKNAQLTDEEILDMFKPD